MIWRLRDGFSTVLIASNFYPRSIQLGLDGQYIASGGYHGNIAIWNVRTGSLVASWQGHNYNVAGLVFTPDGKGLLSASWNSLVMWDVSFLRSLGLGMAKPLISGVMEISRLIGHTVC